MANNLLLDEHGSAQLCDFGHCIIVTSAPAAHTPASRSSGAEHNDGRPCKRQKTACPNPLMTGLAASELYQPPAMGNGVASDVYDRCCDSYAATVLAMSLLLGGWSKLRDVSEALPAGVSQQQRTIDPWLHRIAAGTEQPQLALSRELRDFVRWGASCLKTPEQLLGHPWVQVMECSEPTVESFQLFVQ
jgi:serine/threonine protein kinase